MKAVMKTWIPSRRWLPCLILCVMIGTALANNVEKKKIGEQAPPFKGTSIQGTPVSLDDLLAAKKAVVLSFWGIRCSPCIEEMPALNKIQEDFGAGGVVVVGVNVDGLDGPSLSQLMGEEKVAPRYRVVADPDFKIVDAYKMTAAPLTIVIDPAGVIRYVHEDYRPGDEKGIRDALTAVVKAGSGK